jgi:hypothetical protein
VKLVKLYSSHGATYARCYGLARVTDKIRYAKQLGSLLCIVLVFYLKEPTYVSTNCDRVTTVRKSHKYCNTWCMTVSCDSTRCQNVKEDKI